MFKYMRDFVRKYSPKYSSAKYSKIAETANPAVHFASTNRYTITGQRPSLFAKF